MALADMPRQWKARPGTRGKRRESTDLPGNDFYVDPKMASEDKEGKSRLLYAASLFGHFAFRGADMLGNKRARLPWAKLGEFVLGVDRHGLDCRDSRNLALDPASASTM